MSITITEALCELKTLSKRIEKEISTFSPVKVKVGSKLPLGVKSEEDFKKQIKSVLQSINDLISRRNKIKSAIVASNAVTTVVIGDTQYTVAEAIERKQSIVNEQRLLCVMATEYNNASRRVEDANRVADEKLQKLLEITFGKNSEVDANQIDSITKSFKDQNYATLIDCDCKETMEQLEKDIDSFLTKVDITLTISNSTTMIDV